MRRRTAFMLATVLSAVAVAPVAAQLPDDDDVLPLRSEWGAATLEFLFPFLGHAYAGDPRRGIAPAVPRVAGLLATGHAMRTGTVTTLHEVGLLLGCGGWVWSIVSAWRTAGDWNRAARDRNEAVREGRGVETGFAIRPNMHRQLEFAVNVSLR